MQQLAPELHEGPFLYTQIERREHRAIYQQTHIASGTNRYEAIVIRMRPAHTWPNGTTTPAHEAYPGATSWGRDGWTFHTLAAAYAFFGWAAS